VKILRQVISVAGLMLLVATCLAVVLDYLNTIDSCEEITGEVVQIRKTDDQFGDLEYMVIVRYQNKDGQPDTERFKIDELTFYRYEDLSVGSRISFVKVNYYIGPRLYFFSSCQEVTR
jgi:hypothetical protein